MGMEIVVIIVIFMAIFLVAALNGPKIQSKPVQSEPEEETVSEIQATYFQAVTQDLQGDEKSARIKKYLRDNPID